MDSLKRRVLAWLRIPVEPHVPPGEAASCEVFRAGRGFLAYKLIVWGLGQLFSLAGIAMAVVVIARLPASLFRNARGDLAPLGKVVLFVEVLSFVLFLAQLLFTYWVVRWDYECRFYVLTDRCLRIQEGIWSFREQTFTAANIQDIDVRQNPIQRALGIADVVVSTAGGGGHQGPGESSGSSMHIGYLRGVARAAEIRDRLLAHLKAYRDGGLGDEPSRRAGAPAASPDALREALRELARESRSLREALAPKA